MKLFDRFLELSFVGQEGEGVDLGTLSSDFIVTKTLGRELNRVKLTVYNLSPETISELDTKYRRLRLTAGYVDDAGVIFDGQVGDVFVRQEGTDRITEIYAADGLRDFRYSFSNFSMRGGAKLRDVIATAAAALSKTKISNSTIEQIPDITLSGSQVFAKATRDVLDDLAESYAFDWAILDGSFRIYPAIREPGDDAVLVSPGTGLVGSPILTQRSLEFTSLMNAAIQPGEFVKVETKTGPVVQADESLLALGAVGETLFDPAAGLYEVSRVEHVGKSRGADWYSKAVCLPSVVPSV